MLAPGECGLVAKGGAGGKGDATSWGCCPAGSGLDILECVGEHSGFSVPYIHLRSYQICWDLKGNFEILEGLGRP